MGISVLGIGISGLSAAQAGLVTTGHNISNASTPGFSRQEVVQTTNLAQSTGAGFLGQGVHVSTVKRIYSDVLSNQLASAQSQGAHLNAYNAQIQQIDNMLADQSAGLAPALQEFFSGVNDVAADPCSASSRQSLLSSANSLAARFHSLDQSLEEIRSGVNSGIQSSIDAINGYARQIAALNQNILVAESASSQPANDLRDQRAEIVSQLGQEANASVVRQTDGSYNVFIGNGQPLVVGAQSLALSAVASPEDAQNVDVGYVSGNSTVVLASAGIQGGHLGGLLAFRSETLDAAENALGRVAAGLALSFNDQHRLGQDLDGALGADFFSAGAPAVIGNSGNTGTASVSASIQDAGALTTSDYRLLYQGASGGNENFVLTRVSDGSTSAIAFATATGYPYTQTVDGVTLTLSAGAALHDSWLIEPTRNGARDIGVALKDPNLVAAASPVITAAPVSNTGDAIISAASVTSVANLPLPGTVTLTYSAAGNRFSVAGAVPAVAAFTYTPGAVIAFNGIGFSISGSPADGDTFTVSRSSGAVSDNRNALSLAALQSAHTLGGSPPTTSLQAAYSELVSQVGNKAREVGVMQSAQQNTIAQNQQAQQSVSGVNLDEEAANLLRYQQAYQASAKMIQIAGTLFQAVLQLG